MDNIFIGKITGYHGIKGELKVVSDFELKEKVFKKGFEITLDNETLKITSSRIHKNNYLITVNNLYDLNLVDKYIGKSIFINRSKLNLKNDEYLLFELIGFSVYDGEIFLGKVKDIMYNKNNNFLCVDNFFIPLIDVYIKNVDMSNKKIFTINGRDLII